MPKSWTDVTALDRGGLTRQGCRCYGEGRDTSLVGPDCMQPSDDRSAKELAVLRLMYAVSIRLGDEMRRIAGERFDHVDILALSILNATPGLSQVQLSERLHRTAVYVSRLVDDLERSGLVERRPHPFDRRSKRIWLSDEGQALIDRMRTHASMFAADVFRDTPDERLYALDVQAGRILERLHLIDTPLFGPQAP